MESHKQHVDEPHEAAPDMDRKVLAGALILIIAVTALMVASIALGTAGREAPVAAAGDTPYSPAQFETPAQREGAGVTIPRSAPDEAAALRRPSNSN